MRLASLRLLVIGGCVCEVTWQALMRIILVNGVTWRVSAVSFLLFDPDTGRSEPRAGAVFVSDNGDSRFYSMSPAPTQASLDALDVSLLRELFHLSSFEP